jgi:spermidine synthase
MKENWLEENFTPFEKHLFKINNVLVDTQTKFQKAMLVDTESYKRCLVLDGELQSSELDEFIYHESIVHPAMLLNPNPKRILILGGGEGATLREVLKYKSVQEVVMLDIDGEVVDFCKEHLTMFHKNSFSDKRLKLEIIDAKEYVLNRDEKFDVIISDLCCPVADSPACGLYTKEFYEVLQTRLNDNGVFLAQSGPCEIPQFDLFNSIHQTLKSVFNIVYPFSSFVPSFITPWGFNIAVKNASKNQNFVGFEVEKLLKDRIEKKNGNELRYYDGKTHKKMFNLPKHLRKILEMSKRDTDVITEKSLRFLFK